MQITFVRLVMGNGTQPTLPVKPVRPIRLGIQLQKNVSAKDRISMMEQQNALLALSQHLGTLLTKNV
jgi:hypothetical protein